MSCCAGSPSTFAFTASRSASYDPDYWDYYDPSDDEDEEEYESGDYENWNDSE